jgi:hypothetical protein
MIIRKAWSTEKSHSWNTNNKFVFRGAMYKTRERLWVGYFLFGFIPLYISNYETLYY